MENLLSTKLLSLLSNASQVTNQEMQNAYVCFTEQLRTVSQSETDCTEVYRMLNYTRIELASTETLYQYGQGGKMP